MQQLFYVLEQLLQGQFFLRRKNFLILEFGRQLSTRPRLRVDPHTFSFAHARTHAQATMQTCTRLTSAATRAPAPAARGRASTLAVRAFGPGNEMKDGVEAGTRVKVTAPIKVRKKEGEAQPGCGGGGAGPGASPPRERPAPNCGPSERGAREAPTRTPRTDAARGLPPRTFTARSPLPSPLLAHTGLPHSQDAGAEH